MTGPLVRNAPFDSLRDELLDVLDVALEVAVAGRTARAHRAERAHAAVLLEPFALLEDHVTRRLVGSGEDRACHDGVRAGGQRLRDVARRRHAAVCDQRHAVTRRDGGAIVDRGDLWHADARDDASRANRARPDADLHRIRARVDQRLRRLGRRDVARNDLDVELRLDSPHHLRHGSRMAVRRVDHQHVDTRVDERACALPGVCADTDRGADAQPSLLVLCRLRELDPFLDVLDGDQPLQPSVRVDDRQLLDLVAMEDRLRLRQRRPERGCHQVARGHQRRHRLRRVGRETEIAVRQDPDERAHLVGDRHAGDVVRRHQVERVGDQCVPWQGDGLDDHPGLGALHLVHLRHLRVDRQVAMDDAHAALARQRDRKPRLSDRVHRCRDDRDFDGDAASQVGRGGNLVREDAGLGRDEQNVVERQPLFPEFPVQIEEPLDMPCVQQFVSRLGCHRQRHAGLDGCPGEARPTSMRRRRVDACSSTPIASR